MGRRFVLFLTVAFSAISTASACPWCEATSATFSQEIVTMDAVVIARMTVAPSAANIDEAPIAIFEVEEVIKGGSHLPAANAKGKEQQTKLLQAHLNGKTRDQLVAICIAEVTTVEIFAADPDRALVSGAELQCFGV